MDIGSIISAVIVSVIGTLPKIIEIILRNRSRRKKKRHKKK